MTEKEKKILTAFKEIIPKMSEDENISDFERSEERR